MRQGTAVKTLCNSLAKAVRLIVISGSVIDRLRLGPCTTQAVSCVTGEICASEQA